MEQSPLVAVGLPVALFVIMLGIGLTLSVEDFRREYRAPRGTIVGVAAQALLMPLIGFVLVAILRPPPVIAVGLVICAASPGGTMSNLIAFLARANVALSIILTVGASLVTVATLPVAIRIVLAWQPLSAEGNVVVPVGGTIGLLIGVVVVPVAVGMELRRRKLRRARQIERLVGRLGAGVLVAVALGLAVTLRGDFLALIGGAGPSVLLLNAAGVMAGVLIGWAAGLEVADRITCGIELGMKNTALAMVVALSVVGSPEVAVVPAVYGFVMFASALALVAYGRRRRSTTRPEPAVR